VPGRLRIRVAVIVAVGLLPCGVAWAQPIDWSSPPPLGPERPYRPPRAVTSALTGGGTLLVISDHELPLVTVVLGIVGAGSAADPAAAPGLAGLTADALDEGAGGLAGRELAERLETLGTSLTTWAEEDAAYVRVSALADKVAPSLEVAAKILTAPAFDAAEVRRVHEDRATAIRLRRDRPGAVADLILARALHGERSPYGHPVLGTARGLATVGLEDVRAFHRRRYRRDRLIVVVAGDLSPPAARDLVEQALADWRTPPSAPGASPSPPRAPPSPPAARRTTTGRLLVVDRPGAEQGNVLIGALGPPREDPRSYAFDVLTNLLGGTFTSRLGRRLREELGYTYGVSAETTYLRATSRWSAATAVFTPRTADALGEVLKLLAVAGRRTAGTEELEAARRNLVRRMPLDFGTQADVADAYMGLALNGLPLDWFETYAERIGRVTAAEVRRLAAALLAPRELVCVVVGPMAEVGAALARLGLGPGRSHDPDGEPLP
jgi:zinc protease